MQTHTSGEMDILCTVFVKGLFSGMPTDFLWNRYIFDTQSKKISWHLFKKFFFLRQGVQTGLVHPEAGHIKADCAAKNSRQSVLQFRLHRLLLVVVLEFLRLRLPHVHCVVSVRRTVCRLSTLQNSATSAVRHLGCLHSAETADALSCRMA